MPNTGLFTQVHAVAAVAAQALVATVAGERHGDVFARHLADAVGGDGGAVGEGLVVEVGQGVDQIEIVALDDLQPVVGLVAVGDLLGVFGLVEARVVKADRAGVDRLV